MADQLDTNLLKADWEVAVSLGDQVPLRFYSILFFNHPETRMMFPPGMAAQRDKLVRAIGDAVANVENLDAIAPRLRRLGRDHRRFGAGVAHYGAVLDALLTTFGVLFQLHDLEWTEAHVDTWTSAYEVIYQIMIGAAIEQEEAGIPPWWDAMITEVTRTRTHAVVRVDRTEAPETYVARPGDRIDVMAGHRPGLWTRAEILSPWNGTLDFQVRHQRAPLDIAALAIASLRAGNVLRVGPPDSEPFEHEETVKP